MHVMLRRKLMRAKIAARRMCSPKSASTSPCAAASPAIPARRGARDRRPAPAAATPPRRPRPYVDRMGVGELRAHYPELEQYELVTPDVVDDGESLTTVAADSVDFVVANHLIEHCQDPIGTCSPTPACCARAGSSTLPCPTGAAPASIASARRPRSSTSFATTRRAPAGRGRPTTRNGRVWRSASRPRKRGVRRGA